MGLLRGSALAERALEAVEGVRAGRRGARRAAPRVGNPPWTIVIRVPRRAASNVNSMRRLEARAVEPRLGRGEPDPVRPVDRLEHVTVVVEPVARRAERDRPHAADAQLAARVHDPPGRVLAVELALALGVGEGVEDPLGRGRDHPLEAEVQAHAPRLPALDEALEAIQAALPGAAVALDPLRRLAEPRGSEPALARAPDLLGDDEVGALEDPDVLLDPVEGQPVRPGELADRGRAAAEALEDPAPGRVREGEERPVEGGR